MRIAILYGSTSDQHPLIIESAEKFFDSVVGVPIIRLRCVYGPEGIKLLYKNIDLCSFDAVFLRLFYQDILYGEHIPAVLREKGVYTQVDKDSLMIANNKFYLMKVLADSGIKIPYSSYTLSTKETLKSAERMGYPVVIKLISGYGGKGVMRISKRDELAPLVDTLSVFEQDICMQEYLPNPGEDVRVVVVGDETYTYKRVSKGEEWRSNITAGGDRVPYDAPDEVRRLAVKASRLAGHDFSGVDIIESEKGPMILELNTSPSISKDTSGIVGVNLPDKLMEFVYDRTIDLKAKT